jgi:hypothetical protein
MLSMYMVYLFSAVAGSTILLILFAMTLIGFDHHHFGDIHDVHDGDDGSFLGIFSVRALVSALAFFGLGGIYGRSADMGSYGALILALLAGTIAMVVVAWIMRQMGRLNSQGNVHVESCVGATGKVYLSIPDRNTGTGKVTVTVQNRTMEFQAVTNKEALPTGTPVVVVGIVSPDVLEVESAATTNGER